MHAGFEPVTSIRFISPSCVLGNAADVGPSTYARSISSAGGSSTWNSGTVLVSFASGESIPPHVTKTRARASPSCALGTTNSRRCPRAMDVKPWRLKTLRISGSASNRRPNTNQSSESTTSSSRWSRSGPSSGAGTTTAPPSGSRAHTLVNDVDAFAYVSSCVYVSPASSPEVTCRGSTRATKAPCSGTGRPEMLRSSDGSAA